MKRLLLTGALLALTAPAYAQPSLVASVENDSFIDGIDRHYTNGLYFSWTGDAETRDDTVAQWAQHLMLPADGGARWRDGYFFGQSMFTPENLSARIPPLNDRPYAGWLYGGARHYRDTGDTL